MLDRDIGLVVRRFNLGGNGRGFRGPVVKECIGERAADTLLEQHEERGNFDALGGEPIRVALPLTLKEAVSPQLAHVISELGERIRGRGDSKGFEHGGMQLGGAPAGELRSAMKKDLHQAKHACVVDLDARHLGAPGGDGLGEALEQREVDMHVEEVRLDARQAIGRGDQFLAERRQLLQPLCSGRDP